MIAGLTSWNSQDLELNVSVAAHRLGYQLQSSVGHLTGGLVSDSVHLVLPTITPKITFILTALAIVVSIRYFSFTCLS